MMKIYRGSRKHILDFVSSHSYPQTLNTLLKQKAVVSDSDIHEPKGEQRDNEYEIPDFCLEYCQSWFDIKQLDNWWLPDQPQGIRAKGVTWDLISTCHIDSKRGLLLVEAKAHESELDYAGKPFDPNGSSQSRLNHDQISQCLSLASQNLRKRNLAVKISVESHYQLANRIAWAWKLADCGLSVVLLYLGFLGDKYFRDYLIDADHWQRAMGAYMQGVLPLNLPGVTISGKNGGDFTLLVESLPIQQVSTI
jgi:hypothetical protein